MFSPNLIDISDIYQKQFSGMDTSYLPVQYKIASSAELHQHINYCVGRFPDKAHLFFCDTQIIVPIVKNIRIKKPSTLNLLIRSGSFGRDNIELMYELLVKKGY